MMSTFPCSKRSTQDLLGRIGDADGYIRVEFVELLDIRHQKIAADGIAGADVELSQSGVVDILDLFFAAAYKVHGWFDVL